RGMDDRMDRMALTLTSSQRPGHVVILSDLAVDPQAIFRWLTRVPRVRPRPVGRAEQPHASGAVSLITPMQLLGVQRHRLHNAHTKATQGLHYPEGCAGGDPNVPDERGSFGRGGPAPPAQSTALPWAGAGRPTENSILDGIRFNGCAGGR